MLVLDTKDLGRIAFVRGGPVPIKCTIVGTWLDGGGNKWTRVRLLERDRCHLADDVVDYTSDWID